jgi:hypothetical protein
MKTYSKHRGAVDHLGETEIGNFDNGWSVTGEQDVLDSCMRGE